MDDPPEDELEIERLNAEEVQDLVPIVEPSTHAESVFLLEKLEEAGIPAVTQSKNMLGMQMSTYCSMDICVPRLLVEPALKTIAKARGVEYQETTSTAPAATKPSRGLFHLSLMTILALTLSTGFVLTMNLTPGTREASATKTYLVHGWPWPIEFYHQGRFYSSDSNLMYDIVFGVAMVIASGIAAEWFARAGKGAPPTKEETVHGNQS